MKRRKRRKRRTPQPRLAPLRVAYRFGGSMAAHALVTSWSSMSPDRKRFYREFVRAADNYVGMLRFERSRLPYVVGRALRHVRQRMANHQAELDKLLSPKKSQP